MTTHEDTPPEPWIGDASSGTGCRYAPAPGIPACGARPTLHIVSESAIYGPVTLPACIRHTAVAKQAGPVISQHRPDSPDCHCTQD